MWPLEHNSWGGKIQNIRIVDSTARSMLIPNKTSEKPSIFFSSSILADPQFGLTKARLKS